MKKLIVAFFLMVSLSACNKEIESVPVPPFSVFPNPFTDAFTLYFDPVLSASTSVRILNGIEEEILTFDEIAPGTSVMVDMSSRQSGIYYVELVTGQETTYIQSILKAE